MGGGGVMRAAAKVAGIGAAAGGLRGFPGLPPLENLVSVPGRKATRPVSPIVSSSEDSIALIASQNDMLEASVQRPCWEIDDWELAGSENELFVQSSEPLPRLVFGGVPTIEETKEATSELKDALEKVYLSSPNLAESKDSITGQESSLSLLSDVDGLDTTPKVQSHTLKAFRFFSESPAVQTVVASIASDQNVWTAVLNNPALVEFMESQKTTGIAGGASISYTPAEAEEAENLEVQSPKNLESSSSESGSESGSGLGNAFAGFMGNARVKVVEMVSNLSDYVQNLFGGGSPTPTSSEKSGPDEENAKSSFFDKSGGFMGLAIMVIMVVVLKRVPLP